MTPCIAWLLSSLLGGCAPTEEVPRVSVPDAIVQGVTWRAVVTTAPREPPPRFAAGFPPSIEALGSDPWAWPSRNDLRRGICGSSALRPDAERVLSEPLSPWFHVLGDCTAAMVDDTYCGWALYAVRGQRLGYRLLLPACRDDDGVRRAVAESGSPDAWVVAWSHHVGVPSVERAVRAVMPAVEQGQVVPSDLSVLEALASDPAPEAGRALLGLHGRAPDAETRMLLGHLLWGRDEPVMQRIHLAACRAEEASWCGLERGLDLFGALQAADYDVDHVLEAHPGFRSALVDRLAGCAADAVESDHGTGVPARCLYELAHVDAQRAREVATVDPGANAEWAGLASAVRDPGAVRPGLLAAGFGPLVDEPEGAFASPIDWLAHVGQARVLPDDLAYDYDGPAWMLADLVDFARIDVDTAVTSYAAEGSTEVRRPRRVHLAWLDGLRFRALGAPVDEPFEIGRLVGFVNALLHHLDARRGASGQRIGVGYAEGRTVVVRGTPASLEALSELGWWTPLSPPPRAGERWTP